MQGQIYWDLSTIYQNLYELDESYDLNEDNSDYIVLDYLISEGYTDSVEKASNIVESMSDAWYNLIIEGLPKSKTMSRSEMNSKITELRKKQKELTAKYDPKNPDSSVVNQLKAVVAEIKRLTAAASHHREIVGELKPNRIKEKQKESKKTPLSPEEKKAFKETRVREPEGSDAERTARRNAIAKRTPRRRGESPQATDMNLAPVTTRTSRQRQIAAATQGIVGNMDPVARDRSGRPVSLNSQGETQRTYRSGARSQYQQGASGSGTQSASPAGSTVNPDRPRPRRVR
jgi:hypothetical protein